jgi:hydrogenase nickel incorporation protein HypB
MSQQTNPSTAAPLANAEERRTVNVHQGILLKNDEQAHRNRARFRQAGLKTLNILSSPGAGKTALLARTLADLGDRFPSAVIVGDLATDNDAKRIRQARPEAETRVLQVTTGNVCHLEAAMIERAANEIGLEGLSFLFIENVGNLVCPASFDLGEDFRIVLMSVTEGEDKPLKYPKMFKTADLILITKSDLAEAVGFDRVQARANLAAVAPQANVIELTVRKANHPGLLAWYDHLERLTRHATSFV